VQPDFMAEVVETHAHGKTLPTLTGRCGQAIKENVMQTILIGFIVIVLVGLVISAIMAIAACMRSSQISQMLGENEHELTLQEEVNLQDQYDRQAQWEKLAEICKQETINDIERLR
jgi:hypothetical protein